MNTKQIIAMWIGIVIFFFLCTSFYNAFDRRVAYLVCTLLATLAMILTLKDKNEEPRKGKEDQAVTRKENHSI